MYKASQIALQLLIFPSKYQNFPAGSFHHSWFFFPVMVIGSIAKECVCVGGGGGSVFVILCLLTRYCDGKSEFCRIFQDSVKRSTQA